MKYILSLTSLKMYVQYISTMWHVPFSPPVLLIKLDENKTLPSSCRTSAILIASVDYCIFIRDEIYIIRKL
jgi:hypothetical protein